MSTCLRLFQFTSCPTKSPRKPAYTSSPPTSAYTCFRVTSQHQPTVQPVSHRLCAVQRHVFPRHLVGFLPTLVAHLARKRVVGVRGDVVVEHGDDSVLWDASPERLVHPVQRRLMSVVVPTR
jgi:hypothetical protein